MKLSAPGYWQNRHGAALLLYPLSLLFRLLVRLRRLGFRYGIINSMIPSVPIVVVGNLTVGGAGKTPLVIALVEQLQNEGWQPAVVSRGYGGNEVAPTLVDATADYNIVGDEALMLARRTGVPVAVCAKRAEAVRLLTAGLSCNVIVSDDGLQHYALTRQVEVCVIDASTGLGNGWCLPAGPLREPVSRLREVDLIVYSGKAADQNGISVRQAIENQLAWSPPAQYAYTLRVEKVVNLRQPSLHRNLSEFSARQVHAVAAIGRPDKFFQQLRDAGLDIIEHAFPDHYVFRESDLAFDDGLAVLMTEKDSVKCEEWAADNFWLVEVAAELDSGIVDAVLDRLGTASVST